VVVGYGYYVYEGGGDGGGEIEIGDGQILGRVANWLRAFFYMAGKSLNSPIRRSAFPGEAALDGGAG
jgi:hypothetical protein